MLKALARYPLALLRRVRGRLLAPASADLARLSTTLTHVQQVALTDLFNAVRRLEGESAALRGEVKRLSETTEVFALRADLERIDAQAKSATAAAEERLAALRQRNLMLESLLIGSAQAVSIEAPADPPAVSIIMATRSRAGVIANAIRSVQTQTFPHWELIIVDDGSADHSAPELAGFLKDQRISIHAQPAGGAPAARNRGLALSRAPLIAYLDTDCTWFPGFLAAAVAALAERPGVPLVYGALVTDRPLTDGTRVLFQPYDRERLSRENFIDLNIMVHRRDLVARHGNFDEGLTRLQDWDLVLRYTADAQPLPVPVLAAIYGISMPDRISVTVPAGENAFRIRQKWRKVPPAAKSLCVLYVIWHYPQLSEQYIETEIQCMRRFGVHVEVWCETGPAASYPSSVPIHRGTLADAIAQVRPDVLHIHWINYGHKEVETFRRCALPMTARAHGFEYSDESLRRILAWPWLRRVYVFPHQMPSTPDARIRPMNSAFETPLFKPRDAKDRRLVVRTGSGLASKDLQFVFELAKRLPNFRFVVAAVTCKDAESYIDQLRQDWKAAATPCELMIDVPREKVADLVAQAAFYLHTLHPPGHPGATPVGMPISIAEAMATGAHVLVRDVPALLGYVGEAGSSYRGVEDAAEVLRTSIQNSEDDWRDLFIRSVDRGFTNHADEDIYLPLLEDWCEMAGRSATLCGGSPRQG